MASSFSALPHSPVAERQGTRRRVEPTSDLHSRISQIQARVAAREAEERRRNSERFPFALECLSTIRSRFESAYVEHCTEGDHKAGTDLWSRGVEPGLWTPPKRHRRPPRGLSCNPGNKYGDCGD